MPETLSTRLCLDCQQPIHRPIGLRYRHSRATYCVACIQAHYRQRAVQRYWANPARLRERRRQQYRANREQEREQMRVWRTSPAGREYLRRYEQMPAHRRKKLSRQAARDALKRGALVREPCEVCGRVDSQMHHDDYAQPLVVRWFCWPHHAEYHRVVNVLPR